jgi:putative hydrolase of HD superfamily
VSRVTIAPEEDRLNAQIAFAVEIDKLKRVIRRNHLIDGSRRENTAEHSWYVGTLAMVLGEHAPPGTDLQRVVAMLLVHDLVEIDAVAAQAEAEIAAADRIFGLLPGEQARAMRELWDEFEARRTPEARFAKALDRFAPILANHLTEGGTWPLFKVSASQVREKVRIIEEGSPSLGAYALELVELSVARGHLSE